MRSVMVCVYGLIDVQVSQWLCTIEHEDNGERSLRMGLMYAKGLRQEVGEAIVESRKRLAFSLRGRSDAARPPAASQRAHAAGPHWRFECLGWHRSSAGCGLAGGRSGAAGRSFAEVAHHGLQQLFSPAANDYRGEVECGLLRHGLDRWQASTALPPAGAASEEGTNCAANCGIIKDGEYVRAAGCVIARQRPGTAKGFIFLSMEDETGIANVIITPDLYERERVVVTRSKFVLVEGALQNQDGVIHIKAKRIQPLAFSNLEVRSHDFH